MHHTATPNTIAYPALAGPAVSARLPRAGFGDTVSVLLKVFLPTIAKGAIIRRPAMIALAELLDLDRRAVAAMQDLRRRYGTGPVIVNLFGRLFAVILDPVDVERVLDESPDPFATSTPEKAAALAHFEPKVALISQGEERADRRRYNDDVLQSERHVHALGIHFSDVVASEAQRLRLCVRARGNVLNWMDFSESWFRIARRVVFGNIAAEDDELSDLMARLRHAANWAFLRPQMRQKREALLARIRKYLAHPAENSLAAVMAHVPATLRTAPEQQVPQWLFAFDAAGMTAFRSLALLASHAETAATVRAEIDRRAGPSPDDVPHLRATVLEVLRLWPTSPLILRETTAQTSWRKGSMPSHTGVVIFSPFFHRDNERLPYANRFAPEIWMGKESAQPVKGLIPFSSGPGICPGRQLVLLLTTCMIAELMRNSELRLLSHRVRLNPQRPLPGTLNHFRLRFELA